MFYTRLVQVWEKGQPVSIGGGVSIDGDETLSWTAKVDIQPYSSAQAKKDYGMDIVTTQVMYAPVHSVNIGKSIIKDGDDEYDVIEAVVWDDYMEVMLNRR